MAIHDQSQVGELRNRIRGFITDQTGLYFKDHDLKGLDEALTKRMQALALDSLPVYYNHLISLDHKELELRELLNILTINHTYFYRNEAQFKALKQNILPEIIEQKRKDQLPGQRLALRIWSAGCSTGEEPYSIAMVIRDVIADIDRWDIEILATDASNEALNKARRGLYSKNSVKYMPADHLDRYFVRNESKSEGWTVFTISDVLKKMVTFSYHNLVADEYPAGMDVIFCRNVVIYFEMETTLKIWNRFYDSLGESRYLLIGYSESLYYLSDKFRMVNWDEAIYYRKASAEKTSAPAALPRSASSLDNILEVISRQQVLAELRAEATIAAKALPKKIDEVLVQATKAVHLKRYDQALNFLQDALLIDRDSIDAYYMAAEIYFNQGRLRESRHKLDLLLRLNSLFPAGHYLLGCVFSEEGDVPSAKDSFRKAIYLDKDFLMARFQMANIFKVSGAGTEAIREYRNVLKTLSTRSPSDIIAYSGGFEAATLVSVCRDNIERLKIEQWT